MADSDDNEFLISEEDEEDDDQSDPDEIDNFGRQLDQLCASALANLPGSVGKLSQIEKSLANLSLYSEKYENELNRTINQWSDNVALENIDTAAHLSLNKSLSQMNFLRYEPLGQRVFYNDVTGQPACKWDCAFICVHPVRGDDEDEDEDEEDHYNGDKGELSVVTDEQRKLEKSKRLSSPSRRTGSSEELWGEETQEVIYLVTIEKDMTHARLEDVSRRLFLTLDCMNRTGAVPETLPWQTRARITAQREMRACSVKVVVGGDMIDRPMSEYILASGYSVLFHAGMHYQTILV